MFRYLFLLVFIHLSSLSISQTTHYTGTWTKVNTTYEFDFDLYLNVKESNLVDGYFVWKVVHYDEYSAFSKAYYKNKIGKTAKEFIRGSIDPSTGECKLRGYSKEDPDAIIALDIYQLKIDEKGGIEGETNALGTWLGRIKAKNQEL